MGVAAKERELEGSVQGYLAASGIAGRVSAAVNAAVKARASEPCSFMVPPPPPPPTRSPSPAPPRASAPRPVIPTRLAGIRRMLKGSAGRELTR